MCPAAYLHALLTVALPKHDSSNQLMAAEHTLPPVSAACIYINIWCVLWWSCGARGLTSHAIRAGCAIQRHLHSTRAHAARQVGFPKRDPGKLAMALANTHCTMWIRCTKGSRWARLGQLLGFARATSDKALTATIWDVAVRCSNFPYFKTHLHDTIIAAIQCLGNR